MVELFEAKLENTKNKTDHQNIFTARWFSNKRLFLPQNDGTENIYIRYTRKTPEPPLARVLFVFEVLSLGWFGQATLPPPPILHAGDPAPGNQ